MRTLLGSPVRVQLLLTLFSFIFLLMIMSPQRFPQASAQLTTLTDIAAGLLDEGLIHIPLDYTTPLAPPPKGGAYTDPVYGTEIRRITDGPTDFNTGAHHEYSVMSPFNSDNTYILILLEFGSFYLADLNGNVIIPPDILSNQHGVGALSEPRWSRTDPHVFYYHVGNELRQYDVSTQSFTVLRTFTEYTTIDLCGGSSDISEDGDHLAICGNSNTLFAYQISTDTKFSAKVIDGISDAHMTPNNNILAGKPDNWDLYDINMNFIRNVLPFAGHLDSGRDINGDEIMVITSSNDLSPACNPVGIEKIRLSDSRKTCILPLYWGDTDHMSMSQTGWVAVSNTDLNGTANPPSTLPGDWQTLWGLYYNEVTLVKLDGSEIRRIAHHRSRRFDGYWNTPRVAMSQDGKYLVFDSNFAVYPLSNYTDVYLVDLGGGGTPVADVTPPVISSVTVPVLTSSLAAIAWSTAEPSDSQVEYGETTAYGSSTTLDSSLVTSHSQTLKELSPNTIYHYRVKSRDAAGNLAVSGDFTFTTLSGSTTTAPITWTNLINTTANGSSLQKTSGCDGCQDAGAVSSQTLTGDGYVEFTASETTTQRAIGLSHDNTDTTRADIDFAIQLWPGGGADIRENDRYRAETTYVSGDVFRIAVEAGVVGYYKNGSLFYTSSLAPTYPLLADVSMFSLNGTVSDAVMSSGSSGSSNDIDSPTVSITAPLDGVVVSGAITVSANASDNVGVTGVQFKIDGMNLGSEVASVPYSISWDTITATNGVHVLTAAARDAAGNSTTSSPVTVTVSNDTTPPTISLVSSSNISSSGATITWTTDEASDAQVEYGTTTAYGSLTPLNATVSTSHVLTLTGLSPNTVYHYRVRSRDAAGNLAVSGDFTFKTKPESVRWTSSVNVTTNGDGSLLKTSDCDGCQDAGSVSSQTLTGDGYVEFTASETTTQRAIGLSHGNTDTTRADIDFAVQLWPGGGIDIRENDRYRSETTYVPGDVFRVAVESGLIKYYKNGLPFYTSLLTPTFPLLVDTVIFSVNGTITNAIISLLP